MRTIAACAIVALIATGAAQARTDIQPPEAIEIEAILMPRPMSEPVEQPYLFPRRLPNTRGWGR